MKRNHVGHGSSPQRISLSNHTVDTKVQRYGIQYSPMFFLQFCKKRKNGISFACSPPPFVMVNKSYSYATLPVYAHEQNAQVACGKQVSEFLTAVSDNYPISICKIVIKGNRGVLA